MAVPLIANPEAGWGDLERLDEGVAIGFELARELGLGVGDIVTLISPDGMDTPFGTQPRINDYEVVYVFQVGRWDIDRIRVYMPLQEAQFYFDREAGVDEIEAMVTGAAEVERYTARRSPTRRGRGCISGPGGTRRAPSCRRSTSSVG
jgi:lipoprotein-releasing system permease protein